MGKREPSHRGGSGPWPQHRVAQLKALADGTLTAAEIGKAIGVTRAAVIGYLDRNPGCGTLKRPNDPKWQPFSDIEIQTCFDLEDLGFSSAQIGERIGRPKGSVLRVLRRRARMVKKPARIQVALPPDMLPTPRPVFERPADKPATVCATPSCRLPAQRGYLDGLCAECRRQMMPRRMRAPSGYAVPGF